jgi:predicted acetylornithine/succinylornithine family transaminase
VDQQEMVQEGLQHLLHVYNRFPIVLQQGTGTHVIDQNQVQYLDFLSGIAVNALGMAYPQIVQAIITEAQKISHVSNFFYTETNIRLAKRLCDISFAKKVFFCNSGAEAIESAMKISRKYFARQEKEQYEIISFHQSFHGRTLGALSVTGQTKYQKGFEPLLPGIRFAHLNDLNSVKAVLTPKTAAVLIEPIQGEGGVFPCEEKFLKELRKLTQENNILLILDEIQTGLGRTGKMWAYEHYKITPDILTSAKALGGGLPMGALLVTDQVAEAFHPGDHATTFGGNPIVSAASLAMLEIISAPQFLDNVTQQGDYLKEKLLHLRSKFPEKIVEIRGQGLMWGIEVTVSARDLVQGCLQKGLLISSAGDNVIRLLPPLIVTKSEIDLAIEKLMKVISE